MDPSTFDPEVASVWAQYPPERASLADVPRARAVLRDYVRQKHAEAPNPDWGVTATEHAVPRTDSYLGPIPIRIYRPPGSPSGRGLIYAHGGAFVMGDLDIDDDRCRQWARDGDCLVVSVDYRLAPEHPFPLPLDDCYAVLQWVVANANELGVDPGRIGVGGCSAGGSIAAGAALLCRDRGGPAIGLQVLVYPALDAQLVSHSVRAFLSEDDHREAERMWTYYLGGPRSDAGCYASPSRCADHASLAPAYIAVAEYDHLRDEGLAYAGQLVASGVSAELHLWPRVPHAFDWFAPSARISRRAVKEQAEAIKRSL